jgi:hypothetical protein
MTDMKRWNSEVRPLVLRAAQSMEWEGEPIWAAIIRKQLEEWTKIVEEHKEPPKE